MLRRRSLRAGRTRPASRASPSGWGSHPGWRPSTAGGCGAWRRPTCCSAASLVKRGSCAGGRATTSSWSSHCRAGRRPLPARTAARMGTRTLRLMLPMAGAETRRWRGEMLQRLRPVLAQIALASAVSNLLALATPLFMMTVYNQGHPPRRPGDARRARHRHGDAVRLRPRPARGARLHSVARRGAARGGDGQRDRPPPDAPALPRLRGYAGRAGDGAAAPARAAAPVPDRQPAAAPGRPRLRRPVRGGAARPLAAAGAGDGRHHAALRPAVLAGAPAAGGLPQGRLPRQRRQGGDARRGGDAGADRQGARARAGGRAPLRGAAGRERLGRFPGRQRRAGAGKRGAGVAAGGGARAGLCRRAHDHRGRAQRRRPGRLQHPLGPGAGADAAALRGLDASSSRRASPSAGSTT